MAAAMPSEYLIVELVRRMMAEDIHSFIAQNRRQMDWMERAAQALRSSPDYDEGVYLVLHAILSYDRKYGKMPPAPGAVLDFVVLNPDADKQFIEEGAASKVQTALEDVARWADELPDSVKKLDLIILFGETFSQLRAKRHAAWAAQYMRFATGHPRKLRDGSEVRGPNAAMDYLRECWQAHDYQPEAPKLAGLLHENTDAIGRVVDRLAGGGGEGGRLPLGYWHIDDAVVVGKRDLRFVGIVGQAGDGKTTWLNSIVYNWVLDGAHVLYVSMEHDPEQIFAKFAFLHQVHPDYGFALPSWEEWRAGRGTAADRRNFESVYEEIRGRRNLPGLLDVRQMYDWEGIKSHLAANHPKNRYDALAVDYMARLEVPGVTRPGDRERALDEIIHDAQRLSREFDDNRGLVVVTPIQVNRESSKSALKEEFREGEEHYTLNAIRQHTAFQYDLDLCLSVFSDDEMKGKRQMEVACLKAKDGKRPPVRLLYVDENSKMVTYREGETPEARRPPAWAGTPDGGYVDEMPQY